MTFLNNIPEIANLHQGQGLVRIPMEQDVPFTSRVRAIVDTPAFRRLSQITQLGLASRVYPGAVHDRFEHALGVFHNALQYLMQLGKDPRFLEIIDEHHAELLMVAALLHDLGHWPFCHMIEDLSLPGILPHEEYAKKFLLEDPDLPNVLRTEWGIEPEEVWHVLTAKVSTPGLQMVQSILSGPIDIDKLDYLGRDSHHAGVPYGRNFDKNRLIHSLVVNEAGNGLALNSKGKTAAELMVFARYVMFSEVYWHHAVRSATSMFSRSFYHLYQQLDLETFFTKSEHEFISELRELARNTDSEQLLEGVFGERRQLYKRVAEYSFYQTQNRYNQLARQSYPVLVNCTEHLVELLSLEFNERLTPTDILLDGPSPHREIEFRVEIYFPKEREYLPLQQVSPVVDTLARTQFDDYVKRVRIFAHPRLSTKIGELTNFEDLVDEAARRTAARLSPGITQENKI